jgi:hypothetical protein
MDVNREIVQKRFSVRLTHRFEKDRFVYTLRDLSGEIQFAPKYETLLMGAPYTFIVQEKRLQRLAVVALMAINAIALVMFLLHDRAAPLFGAIWLVVLIALLVLQRLGAFSAKCTLLKMEPPPPGAGKLAIRVIQDKHHDEIMAELKARWLARLRQLHLAVNPLKQPVQEQSKFAWLRDNGVITDAEYDRAIEELRGVAAQPSAAAPALARAMN